MVSTYYYIYIIVTYYVVNGITIIKYLHNVNMGDKGTRLAMSTLCAAYICGISCGIALLVRETVNGENSLFSENEVSTHLGSRAVRCVPHSLPPPKKICVFLYSQIAGCFAVAGISFYGF